MTGLDIQRSAGEDVLRRVDEHPSEECRRHPGVYVVVDVALLCLLGALAYGLVRFI